LSLVNHSLLRNTISVIVIVMRQWRTGGVFGGGLFVASLE
jgi:hypothetical protein